MRLGLIARCDNRGIAYQTLEIAKGMKPDKILVVMMGDKRWPEQPERLARLAPKVIYADSNMNSRRLPQTKVKDFLDDLDAVIAVETIYDWRMIEWADERGVKITGQGNPEFYTHHRDTERPHPHQWVWPTSWMTDGDVLPDGMILPVPAPTPPADMTAVDPGEETLRVLHVAGHRALGDRNGTDLFCEAIRNFEPGIEVTIVGQDNALPDIHAPRGVTVHRHPGGFADRWDLYRDQHLIVLPRRYGGLCLPAIEASACSVVPMMPDAPENDLWPTLALNAKPGRLQRVPYGHVPTHLVRPNTIADRVNRLHRGRHALDELQSRAWDWAAANDWDAWRPKYEQALA